MKFKQLKSTSKSRKYGIKIYSFIFLVIALCYSNFAQSQDTLINRDLLIQDARQMAHVLEMVHPDPYINGGGKIAFQRRLHELISSIPDSGLNAVDFGWRLQEFVGWLGDPHSTIRVPLNYNGSRPGGIPVYFNAIEDMLYAFAYTSDNFYPPLGSVLLSVEGVEVAEIYRRYGNLTGNKNNLYNVLELLRGGLWDDVWLTKLLPEWRDKKKINIVLKHPDGIVKEHMLEIPSHIESLQTTDSKLVMPSTQKCDFTYEFMGDNKETALLVINSMVGYREAFEIWYSRGRSQLIQQYKGAYQRANGEPAPDKEEDIIAGIPSATETFLTLLKEMKEAGTKNLIVDLRRNNGGSSTMADILTYLIYGEEILLSTKSSAREVKKLSDHYFDLHSKESIDIINEDKQILLSTNDYLFMEDTYGWNTDLTPKLREIAKNSWNSRILEMPTFKSIYDNGNFDKYYTPQNVMVVSSSKTFSSGFTLMERLHRAGAMIVGRPSGQEPNAFGSWQEYTLNNSKITGYVSHKYFWMFPDDSEFAHVIKPDYELTYEQLKSYDFDRNADILFALEILSKL